MASHKAPSEVTIVSHEDKSAFADFVERHWLKAALLAAVGAAAILFIQYQSGQKAVAMDRSWADLMATVHEDERGVLIGDPAAIEAVLPSLAGTGAGPWALYFEANSLRKEGRYDEAIACLARIRAEYPEHPLSKDTRTYGDEVTPLSQPEYLAKVFASEKKWREENPGLFENPAPAAGSPRARIQTDQGDIVVVLDQERAPLHVENFIKLAGEGFYDGLLVHRAVYGQMIEAGDPTTRDAESDALSWGQTGNDENIAKEDTGLSHFAGAITSMGVPGSEETSGSLFSIMAAPVHGFDSQNNVFGQVIEGQDIVEEISKLPADITGQRPETPAVIQSITILPGA